MGSNSGSEVDRYLAVVGLTPGHPWCAAFACSMVFYTLTEMGETALPHPMTGSSGGIVQWGQAHARKIPQDQAQKGDLGIVIDPTSPTGYRHTTILWHPLSGNLWATVEGNEGDMVRVWQRDLSTLTIIRPYTLD